MNKKISEMLSLSEYAINSRERDYLEKAADCKSLRELARVCGVDRQVIRSFEKRLKRRAAHRGEFGDNPAQGKAPEGWHAKGLTQYVKEDGTLGARWVQYRNSFEAELQASFLDAVRDVVKGYNRPKPKVVAPQLRNNHFSHILLGDPHFGMLSYRGETGEDYDLETAVADIRTAVASLIASTPPSEEVNLIAFGDNFHANNNLNRTPNSSNVLDTSDRTSKILSYVCELFAEFVDMAQGKFPKVNFYLLEGNHDPDLTLALRAFIAGAYRNYDNVNVVDSPSKFQFFERGETLHMFTHGDTPRDTSKLVSIMSEYNRPGWGRCAFREVFHGHVHHKSEKYVSEHLGVPVRSVSVLCPPDYWHHSEGYHSLRQIESRTYDSFLGLVSTQNRTINWIRQEQAKNDK